MTFKEIFFYILILLGILPTLFYFKKGSKNDNYLKFLFPFILFFFIASFYELIFTHFLKIGSRPWFRIYKILEFFGLLYFYYKLLGKKKLTFFWAIMFILNYTYLIYVWTFQPSNGFNKVQLDVIITLMVIVYTIIWLVETFKKIEETSLHLNPLFYIIGAILLYYCSTFIMFILYDFMIAHKIKTAGLYIIIYYANIVLRATFAIVFWKASRNRI